MNLRVRPKVKALAGQLRQEGQFQQHVFDYIITSLMQELQFRGYGVNQEAGLVGSEPCNRQSSYATLERQFQAEMNDEYWQSAASRMLTLEQGGFSFSDPEAYLQSKAEHPPSAEEIFAQVVQEAAHYLLHPDRLVNLPTEAIEILVGLKQAPVAETDLFIHSDISPLPTSHIMVSSTALHLRKDRWQSDPTGLATYRHQSRSNASNCIEHYISTPGDVSLLPWEEAQQIIDKLGFETAKLHLLFAAHAFRQEKPWETKFTLKATDILKNLGWDKRTDKSREALLNEVAAAAYVLDCLLVKSTWIEGSNAQGLVQASTPTGRLWHVLNAPWGNLNLFNGGIDKPYEVYITIQPGLWTQNTLNKAGQRARQALYQFGYLAEEILRIDPYHNELALRLAIHLTMQSRFRQSGLYRVRTLLEEVLPGAAIDDACSDYRRAYKIKQKWDSALNTLIALKWQVVFDDEAYPDWLRPGRNPQLRPEGWRKQKLIDRLLEAKLTIQPPEPIPGLIAAGVGTTREPLPVLSTKTTTSTGMQIRAARQAKGWTQRQLAGYLGVSQSLVKLWEQGQRDPNSAMKEKICQVFLT